MRRLCPHRRNAKPCDGWQRWMFRLPQFWAFAGRPGRSSWAQIEQASPIASSCSCTCVLRVGRYRCISHKMRGFSRLFLVLMLLGCMVVSTALAPAAAQAAQMQAVTATPCCPDDCPPKPECGPACAALMQCRASPANMLPEIGLDRADNFGALTFNVANAEPYYSVVQTGLRRPPRV